MVTYEVNAAIADPAIAARYEEYMRAHHLRDVLASGCFVEAILEKTGEGQFRTRYIAQSQADVDRYLDNHTAKLRADFNANFPTGVTQSRNVWTELATRHR